MKKFFLLLIASALIATSSKAAVILTGHVKHLNSFFFFFTIQSDSNFYQVTTDSGGHFSIDLTGAPNYTINCFFTNCHSTLFDTTIHLIEGTNIWDPDYCPDTTSTIGSCIVSFTSVYCVCNNVFFLEVDTSQIPGATNIQWDFGDGNSSTQLFTSHEFSENDLYHVCLRITMPNSDTCSYCHDLGFDTAGNLITKDNGAGFSMESIRKGTLNEHTWQEESFQIVSNPVSSEAFMIVYANEQSVIQLEVIDRLGRNAREIKMQVNKGQNTVKMNLAGMPPGLYILTARLGSRLWSEKIFKI